MKQCPNCKNNLADYVPVCPYCGVNVAVAPIGSAQPVWTGPQEKSTYATACPNIGYPKALANLGPGVTGTDKCAHADLVRAPLAMPFPVKNGYSFFYNVDRTPMVM